MNVSKILTFVVLSMLALAVNAQKIEVEKLPSKKILKMAQDAEALGDIYSAVDYYKIYVEKEPEDYASRYRMGQLAMAARDYKKAEIIFDSLYANASGVYPQSLFFKALMIKMQGNYSLALPLFKEFKKIYKGRDFAKRTDNEIKGCEMALSAKKTETDIIHLNNQINKPHIEFSPLILNTNTLLYGTLDVDSIPVYNKIEKNPIPYRSFAMAKRKSGDQWEKTNELPMPINFNDMHSGNGALSPDGKRFYFTKSITNTNNKPITEIYYIVNKDGSWSDPIRMPAPVNIPEYSSTMPTIGTQVKKGMTREILYFASNRPTRSEGGWDIWYSIMELPDSTFRKVDNAGRKINTPGNEITPYVDNKNRNFYFSSDFHPGFGGYDIFKTRGSSGKFQNPENVKMPINSSADDLYFTTNPYKREEGFFVSNRTGSNTQFNPNCCDDIYAFILKDLINLNAQGKVVENPLDPTSVNKGQPLDGAIAMLYIVSDTTGSDEDAESLIYIGADTTDENGNYNLELEKDADYRIMLKKDGYFYKQISFNTFGKTRSENIALATEELDEISNKPYVFYIYYDVDKAEVTPESARTIDSVLLKVLAETPDIIVEISAHTDNQGDSLYNIKLSQARADNVVKYLTAKGIEINRLISRGYGEDRPIAPNDTPENMALNRRTEFSVVGSIDPFSKLNTTKFRIIKPEEKKIVPEKPATPSKSGVIPVKTPANTKKVPAPAPATTTKPSTGRRM